MRRTARNLNELLFVTRCVRFSVETKQPIAALTAAL
jgi:hypothetical protein